MIKRTILTILLVWAFVPAGTADAAHESADRFVSPSWTFRDVDVQQLVNRLKSVGIRLPFEVQGRITTELKLQIPVFKLNNARAYRFDGKLTSPRLVVAGVAFKDFETDLRYRDGVMTTESLKVSLPDEQRGAAAGQITGRVEMGLVPLGQARMSLQLIDVQLDSLADSLLENELPVTGVVNGQIEAEVPVVQLTEIEAIVAEGKLDITKLSVSQRPPMRLSVESIRMREGAVQADPIRVQLRGAEVTGRGQITLKDEFVWNLRGRTGTVDLEQLVRGLGLADGDEPADDSAKLPALQGQANLELESSGSLLPYSVQVRGRVQAESVSVQEIPIDRLAGIISGDGQQWRIEDFEVGLYGGQMQGDIQWDVQRTVPITAQLVWKQVPLGQLYEDLTGYSLGIDGGLAGEGQFSGPFPQREGLSAWRYEGPVRTDKLGLWGAVLTDVTGQMTLADGNLVFSDLAGTAYGGPATGDVSLNLSGTESDRIQVNWTSSRGGDFLRDLLGAEVPLSGLTAGNVDLRHAVGAWSELTNWQGTVQVRGGSELILAGEPLTSATFDGQLDAGRITIDDLRLTMADEGHLFVTGQIDATGTWPFAVNYELHGLPSAAITRFVSPPDDILELDGTVSSAGRWRGQWQSQEIAGQGRLVATRANFLGLAIDPLLADYELSDSRLRLFNLAATSGEGTIGGEAEVALSDDGTHRLDLVWERLIWTVSTSRLPLPVPPTRLQLATAGRLRWSVVAKAVAHPAAHRGQLVARVVGVPGARQTGVPGNSLVRLSATESGWEYSLESETLGGTANLKGTADWPPEATWTDTDAVRSQGELKLAGVQAARVVSLWQEPAQTSDWTGTVQAQLTWQQAAGRTPNVSGSVAIQDVAWQRQTVIPSLQLRLFNDENRIRFDAARGTFAGGTFVTSGSWAWGDRQQQLTVRLEEADLTRIGALISPAAADSLAGRVSVNAMINSDRQHIHLTGNVSGRDAELAGLPVRSLRVPVSAEWSPQSGRWRIETRDLQAAMATGQVAGRLRISALTQSQNAFDIDGKLRARNVDFEELLELMGNTTSFGDGNLTGELELRTRRAKNWYDLTGRFDARLDGTQASAVPGLSQSQNYLGAFSLRSIRFDRGRLRGRLHRGVARVEELTLVSPQLTVTADGTVELRRGRLDLNAVAATGSFERGNPALVELAARYALEAAVPVTLLIEANQLISDRTIFLHFGGTVVRPQVSLRPAATIGAQAIRFLFRELLGVAGEQMVPEQR